MDLNLTERQRATVASALTILGTAVILYAVWMSGSLLVRFLGYFSSVILPPAVAAILAVLLHPFYYALLARVRYPIAAVALVYVCALAPLLLLFWFFGSLLLDQVVGLVDSVPHWLDHMQVAIQHRMPGLLRFWQEHEVARHLREWVSANGRSIATSLGSMSGGVLAVGADVIRTLVGLIGWAVLPIYLAYFLMAPPVRWDTFDRQLPFLRPEMRQDVIYLAREFVNILIAYFRGQLLVAGLQGLLYAIAFALVGVPYGLAIGLLMGVLNVVPYLGTIVGLLLALPLGYAHGGVPVLAGAGVAFCVVQVIESYFITPRIMGDRTGLHPLVIMMALFFWGAALGGVMGLVLAIPLTAFFVVVWRLLKAKYLRVVT